MLTIVQYVHLDDCRYVLSHWRFTKQPLYSLWLYFGEITDDGPDDDGSYSEQWLNEHAIRLHGTCRDYILSWKTANTIADLLRADGETVAVETIVF